MTLYNLIVSDVLREHTSGRLGVHGHRIPVGSEDQLRDDRRVGECEDGRLSRFRGARQPDAVFSRLVDGRG